MSSDCKECQKMLQEKQKRKSLNQMSEAERDLYWESYKNLVGDSNGEQESSHFRDGEKTVDDAIV